MMHAAIYLRVSRPDREKKEDGTVDYRQHVENQLPLLQEYCTSHKFSVSPQHTYIDRETGTGKKRRPEFERMMQDAKAHKWDVVVFWNLDRFGRKGTFETLNDLNTLTGYGVQFVSVQEQYLDSLGPFREAVIGILAAIAKQESMRISQRVKAGLDRVRREGKKLGRKERTVDMKALESMVAGGMSVRAIAAVMGVSRGTVQNRKKEMGCATTTTSTQQQQ